MLYNKQIKWELRQHTCVCVCVNHVDRCYLNLSSFDLQSIVLLIFFENDKKKYASLVQYKWRKSNQGIKDREKLQYNNVQFFNLCHVTLLPYSYSVFFLNKICIHDALDRGRYRHKYIREVILCKWMVATWLGELLLFLIVPIKCI